MGDLEEKTFCSTCSPIHRGQQSRVRNEIRARLWYGFKNSSEKRPPSQSRLTHYETRLLEKRYPPFSSFRLPLAAWGTVVNLFSSRDGEQSLATDLTCSFIQSNLRNNLSGPPKQLPILRHFHQATVRPPLESGYSFIFTPDATYCFPNRFARNSSKSTCSWRTNPDSGNFP